MNNKILSTIVPAFLFLTLILVSCSNTEVPVEEGYKSINDTEIFFKRMGSGEPIIVIHGGPVLDHSYLAPHLKPLSDNYELIYFDQRLSGRSAGQVDSADVRISNFVNDIEELRKALNVGKVHLAGHSWGGLLAMHYAIKYPGNLRSLSLLNSMPASSELWRKEEQILAQRTSKKDSLKRQAIRNSDMYDKNKPEAIEQLLILSFRNQFYDTTLADHLEFYIPDDYMSRSQQFGNVMVDIAEYDLHDSLSSLEVPTLLIYGQHEPAATLSGEKLDATIPNSQLVVIKKSGHFPFIEKPDRFLTEWRSFLETQSQEEDQLKSQSY